MDTRPKFLQRSDAAEYIQNVWGLRCSKRRLANLAVTGGGPVFRKHGRDPVYLPGDLDAWAAQSVAPAVASS